MRRCVFFLPSEGRQKRNKSGNAHGLRSTGNVVGTQKKDVEAQLCFTTVRVGLIAWDLSRGTYHVNLCYNSIVCERVPFAPPRGYYIPYPIPAHRHQEQNKYQ